MACACSGEEANETRLLVSQVDRYAQMKNSSLADRVALVREMRAHEPTSPRVRGVIDVCVAAYDEVLAKPALRATLERKYGESGDEALKHAMLMDALAKQPFLKAWLEHAHGEVTATNLRARLTETAKLPTP